MHHWTWVHEGKRQSHSSKMSRMEGHNQSRDIHNSSTRAIYKERTSFHLSKLLGRDKIDGLWKLRDMKGDKVSVLQEGTQSRNLTSSAEGHNTHSVVKYYSEAETFSKRRQLRTDMTMMPKVFPRSAQHSSDRLFQKPLCNSQERWKSWRERTTSSHKKFCDKT